MAHLLLSWHPEELSHLQAAFLSSEKLTGSWCLRYKGRGLFLKAPYVGLSNGRWQLLGAARSESAEAWTSLEEVLHPSRRDSPAAQEYRQRIGAEMDRSNCTLPTIPRRQTRLCPACQFQHQRDAGAANLGRRRQC